MARVGVHIEAELAKANVNVSEDDQLFLFDEIREALVVYFTKITDSKPVKVESLTIDYGKLGKKESA